MQLRHAWLHPCSYDRLYHSRRNDRDREYECDRGIICTVLQRVKPINDSLHSVISCVWVFASQTYTATDQRRQMLAIKACMGNVWNTALWGPACTFRRQVGLVYRRRQTNDRRCTAGRQQRRLTDTSSARVGLAHRYHSPSTKYGDHIQCESKKIPPPWGFLTFSPTRLRIFRQILHAY